MNRPSLARGVALVAVLMLAWSVGSWWMAARHNDARGTVWNGGVP